MNLNWYERGTCRLATGILLAFGLAGAANNGPILLRSVPLWLLALALGVWGGIRMRSGPSLPRLARWWASTRLNPRVLLANLNFPSRRRHAQIYLRAARR